MNHQTITENEKHESININQKRQWVYLGFIIANRSKIQNQIVNNELILYKYK
jgi:hypothetical protein